MFARRETKCRGGRGGRRCALGLALLLLLLAAWPAFGADVAIELSGIEYRVLPAVDHRDQVLAADQAIAGDIIEVSVGAVNVGSEPSSNLQIAFFYTEERSSRHNLIGISTTDAIEGGEAIRPTVYWDTTYLTPGIYIIVAAATSESASEISQNKIKTMTAEGTIEEPKTLKILYEGEAVIWPTVEGALNVDSDDVLQGIPLCSFEWYDSYTAPFSFTNLGMVPLESLAVAMSLRLTGDAWEDADTQSLPGVDVAKVVEPGAKVNANIEWQSLDLIDATFAAVFGALPRDSRGFKFASLDQAYEMALTFTITPGSNPSPTFGPVSLTHPGGATGKGFAVYPELLDFVFPAPAACSLGTSSEIAGATCSSAGAGAIHVPPAAGRSGMTYLAAADELFALNRSGKAKDCAKLGDVITRQPVWGLASSETFGSLNRETAVVFAVTDVGEVHAFEASTIANSGIVTDFAEADLPGWADGVLDMRSGAASVAVAAPYLVFGDDEFLQYIIVASEQEIRTLARESDVASGMPWASVTSHDIDADGGIVVATKREQNGISRPDRPGYAFFFGRRTGTSGRTRGALYAANLRMPEDVKGITSFDIGAEPTTTLALWEHDDREFVFFGTAAGEIVALSGKDAWGGASGGFVTSLQIETRALMDRQIKPVVGFDIVEDNGSYSVYASTASRLYVMPIRIDGASIEFGEPAELQPSLSRRPDAEMTSGPVVVAGLVGHAGVFVNYTVLGDEMVAGFSVAKSAEGGYSIDDIVVRLWTPAEGTGLMSESLYATFQYKVSDPTQPIVARIGGSDWRLLISATSGSSGRLYAFDIGGDSSELRGNGDLEAGASTITEGSPSG